MKSVRRRSMAAEDASAVRLGGRRQIASGSLWGIPGDIVTDVELVEHKMTGKKQITLKSSWLKKIWEEAIRKSRRPVLQFELESENYFVLREEDYEDLRARVISCQCHGRSG